jgi:hypothetical protein
VFEALGEGDCVEVAELLVELGAGLTEDEGEGDAADVGVATGVELGDGIAVEDGVDVGVEVGVTAGFGPATFTPLPQTNFLPLLTHLYLYPETIVVAFNFVQVAPALTAANPGTVPKDMARETNIETIIRRRTSSMIRGYYDK